MDGENIAWRAVHNTIRRRAQKPRQAAASMAAHNDKVGVALLGNALDFALGSPKDEMLMGLGHPELPTECG